MKLNKKEGIRLASYALTFVLTLVAFILFVAPFVQGKLFNTTISGYDLAFNFDSGKNGALFVGWLLSLLLLLGSVCLLANFLLAKLGVLKLNLPKVGKTGVLVCAGVELALFVVAAILIFVTVPAFGIGDAYNLGGGAITAGILLILAGLLSGCELCYSTLAK